MDKIKAEQKYVRTSPQKLRLIVKTIKDFSPDKALEYLKFLNKRAAEPLAKTIKQAIGNAVNNKKIKEEFEFDKIEITPGSVFKRFRPVSRGRAHPILKRTSHIKVILRIKKQNKKRRD